MLRFLESHHKALVKQPKDQAAVNQLKDAQKLRKPISQMSAQEKKNTLCKFFAQGTC